MAAFNIEDLPPIWPGGRFDLAATIRGVPLGTAEGELASALEARGLSVWCDKHQ